jgi:hypothetical protein
VTQLDLTDLALLSTPRKSRKRENGVIVVCILICILEFTALLHTNPKRIKEFLLTWIEKAILFQDAVFSVDASCKCGVP